MNNISIKLFFNVKGKQTQTMTKISEKISW
jgi:hypothetical protein